MALQLLLVALALPGPLRAVHQTIQQEVEQETLAAASVDPAGHALREAHPGRPRARKAAPALDDASAPPSPAKDARGPGQDQAAGFGSALIEADEADGALALPSPAKDVRQALIEADKAENSAGYVSLAHCGESTGSPGVAATENKAAQPARSAEQAAAAICVKKCIDDAMCFKAMHDSIIQQLVAEQAAAFPLVCQGTACHYGIGSPCVYQGSAAGAGYVKRSTTCMATTNDLKLEANAGGKAVQSICKNVGGMMSGKTICQEATTTDFHTLAPCGDEELCVRKCFTDKKCFAAMQASSVTGTWLTTNVFARLKLYCVKDSPSVTGTVKCYFKDDSPCAGSYCMLHQPCEQVGEEGRKCKNFQEVVPTWSD